METLPTSSVSLTLRKQQTQLTRADGNVNALQKALEPPMFFLGGGDV